MEKTTASKYFYAKLFLLSLIIESINAVTVQAALSDDLGLLEEPSKSIVENNGAYPIVDFLQQKQVPETDTNADEHIIQKRCTHGCSSSRSHRHRHRHHRHRHHNDGPYSNPYPGAVPYPYPNAGPNPYPGSWPNSYPRPWPTVNQMGMQPYQQRYRRSLSLFDVNRRVNHMANNPKQLQQVSVSHLFFSIHIYVFILLLLFSQCTISAIMIFKTISTHQSH